MLALTLIVTCVGLAPDSDLLAVPQGWRGRAPALTVQPNNGARRLVVPWESEATANKVIALLGATGGGTVQFSDGLFEIRNGIFINRVDNVQLRGGEKTRLVFPPPDPRLPVQLTQPALEGEREIFVDDGSRIRVGARYQIYGSTRASGRMLEFIAVGVNGNEVTLNRAVRYLPGVAIIPSGAMVLEEFNFFRAFNSDNLSIENFEMDGRGWGPVEGHTMYCGVLVQNYYYPNVAIRPSATGLDVVGNHIHGLSGRAVTVYAGDQVVIEHNLIENVVAGAIEIDHYAQGIVANNRIRNVTWSAIALNDAYPSIVRDNHITGCAGGVGFVRHFVDPGTNVGTMVLHNVIEGPCTVGVFLRVGINNNLVTENVISGMTMPVLDLGQNLVFGNIVLP